MVNLVTKAAHIYPTLCNTVAVFDTQLRTTTPDPTLVAKCKAALEPSAAKARLQSPIAAGEKRLTPPARARDSRRAKTRRRGA